MRKKKHGAERMQACSDIWITEPGKYKGHWRDELAKDRRLCLEIGCGKGEYAVELGKMYPEKNFIGLDIKGARMWKGAKAALEAGFPRESHCFS